MSREPARRALNVHTEYGKPQMFSTTRAPSGPTGGVRAAYRSRTSRFSEPSAGCAGTAQQISTSLSSTVKAGAVV